MWCIHIKRVWIKCARGHNAADMLCMNWNLAFEQPRKPISYLHHLKVLFGLASVS